VVCLPEQAALECFVDVKLVRLGRRLFFAGRELEF